MSAYPRRPETSSSAWIGYQVLFGLGVGFGVPQTLVAVQAALDLRDIPIGNAVTMFIQVLAGAVFVSVGQSIFTNELTTRLAETLPGFDADTILGVGATELRNSVAPELLPEVISAYNDALTQTFLVGAGVAAATIFGTVCVPWVNIKVKKEPQVAAV